MNVLLSACWVLWQEPVLSYYFATGTQLSLGLNGSWKVGLRSLNTRRQMHIQPPFVILSLGSLHFDPSLKVKKVAIPHFKRSLPCSWEFQRSSTDLLDSSWQQIFVLSIRSHGTLGKSSKTADSVGRFLFCPHNSWQLQYLPLSTHFSASENVFQITYIQRSTLLGVHSLLEVYGLAEVRDAWKHKHLSTQQLLQRNW